MQHDPAKTVFEQTPQGSKKPCVICAKPSVEKYRPFCSKRCADIDLGKWLNGSYSIAGDAHEDGVYQDFGDEEEF